MFTATIEILKGQQITSPIKSCKVLLTELSSNFFIPNPIAKMGTKLLGTNTKPQGQMKRQKAHRTKTLNPWEKFLENKRKQQHAEKF
jgi:hypothetical protein